MQKLNRKDAEPEVIDRLRAFLEHDTGRDFVMVNLIKLNDQPTPVEGVPSTAPSMARLNRYNAGFLLPLLKGAGHPARYPALELIVLYHERRVGMSKSRM